MNERDRDHRFDRLAFLLIWVPYAALVRRLWFVADDAYISFRYSRNWGSGIGLRFNPGDHTPAEGYSNFLMVAAGAVIEKLGLDMQFWLPLLCALCGSLLLWLVFRVLRARLEVSLLCAFLATAGLAWSAPFLVWSSSGLEAMPYALLFFATCERLFLRRDSAAGFTAGCLAVLFSMTRVEGIAWAILVFPALAFLSRRLASEPVARALKRYFAVLVVGYGAYFLWRWNLFGLPWPTTVYAKVGFTLDRALRGIDYLAVQGLTTLSLFAIIPGWFAAISPRRRAIGIPVALLPPGCALYTILIGGDWMTFARFLLPALSFIALLFGCSLHDWSQRLGRGAGFAMGAAAIVLGLLPAFDIHPIPEAVRARFHYRLNTPNYRSEFAQWEFMRWNGIRWSVKGHALAALGEEDFTVVMGAIGAASFFGNCICLDRHGFVTPEVALQPAEPGASLRSPGHDKVVPEAWFVEHGYDPLYLRAKLHDATSRAALVKKLQSSSNRLRRTGHDDRYVLVFHRVGLEERAEGQPTWYLLLWRRINQGQSSEDAWRNLDQQIAQFLTSGTANSLDVAPPGDRVPGIPDWF